MYLEELIGNVQLENDKFECKSRLNREDVVGWLKSIAGFANALGGTVHDALYVVMPKAISKTDYT